MAKGELNKAIAVGRAINIFIGILCVLALSWGGWLMGGKRKANFAVAVPALGVMMYDFTALNLNYAVDVLLILLATLTMISIYKLLTYGLKYKYITALIILNILGMATKISYVVFLGLSLVGIAASAYIHRNESQIGKLNYKTKAIITIAGLLIAVILAVGWFYYFKVYKVSGSLLTARPPGDYPPSHRTVKTLKDVFGTGQLWSLLYTSFSAIGSLSVALISFTASGIMTTLNRTKIRMLIANKLELWNIIILFLAVLGLFVTQIKHADGTGGYYFRYMLPALLPMGLFLAYGLLEFKWTKGLLVWLFSCLMGIATIYKLGSLDSTSFAIPGINNIVVSLRFVDPALSKNGIPQLAGNMLLIVFLLGSVLLAISLYKLSGFKLKKVNQAA
jgi:hypothetical protein